MKQNRGTCEKRKHHDMKIPTEPPSASSDANDGANDLLHLTELHATAQGPVAPEAQGSLADLQSWDEPVDERGHRVGASSDDDPTLGADLVQQGVDEADTEARKWARGIPDAG